MRTDVRRVQIKEIWKPHKGQVKIESSEQRFVTANCGRRWGKTKMARRLIIQSALRGLPVGYWGPTYKDIAPVWRSTKRLLKSTGLIRDKSEQEKYIELSTGGNLEFWSFNDPDNGRGRKYGLVVIDEVAKARNRIVKEAWEHAIRATLTDLKGRARFFSTPKGRNNYWHELCSKKDSDWIHINAPSADNPYLPAEEIELARKDLPQLVFDQEYGAQFVDFTEHLWAHEFDEDVHVLYGDDQIDIDDSLPLCITFDFNVNPTTAHLFQVDPFYGIYFLHEFQVVGGTERLCIDLQGYRNHKSGLKVTGDRSGTSASTVGGIKTGGESVTDYTIIRDNMGLIDDQIINTRGINMDLELSKSIINYAFRHDLVFINQRCEQLINDLSTAIPNKNGFGLHKDRDYYKNDALDAFRYGIAMVAENHINTLKEFRERVQRQRDYDNKKG